MRVLVLGGGGREHALVWKIAQSPLLSRLFAAPGNPGTAEVAENIPCPDLSPQTVIKFVREYGIELVVVGPEVPLAEGVADIVRLQSNGCEVFGPDRAACKIEWSKSHGKDFMLRHGIPTASYRHYDRLADAIADLVDMPLPYVIKTDGLAAGKGVVVCHSSADVEQAMSSLSADEPAVVEEFLQGRELSLHFITDGANYHMLELAEDHKQLYDGDIGPNTGGMGAYSPLHDLPDSVMSEAGRIADATMRGLKRDGLDYRGVIFAGLMLTEQGLKVLEYNCRFGDPETQVMLPRFASDILPYLWGAAVGKLPAEAPQVDPKPAVCVVACSGGYPQRSSHGEQITGVGNARARGTLVFHAGTAVADGHLVTKGGRILNVVGRGKDLDQAILEAYSGISLVGFSGMQFRGDIGSRTMKRG